MKKRLFDILISENENFKLQFIQAAEIELKKKRIQEFRDKYEIDKTFRFNGEMIWFYGDGIIKCGINSYISDYSMLQSFEGCKIIIGNNCSISSNVRVFTQTNVADQDFANTDREIKTGDVIIEDNVWIGANVVINPGITIGQNSIVGANSVVTKSIPSHTIYGGVPARLIKNKSR